MPAPARFRVLEEHHGVPEEAIATLERHYGPRFPRPVGTPVEAFKFLLSVLPWSHIHPLIRGWLDRAYARGGGDCHQDARARRVLGLLVDEPDEDSIVACMNELKELIDTLVRVRGLDEGIMAEAAGDPRITTEMRAYAAGYAASVAASAANAHHDQDMVRYSACVAGWMTSQLSEEEHDLAESVDFDFAIQEVAKAAAGFLGSFAGWGKRQVLA